MELKSFAKINLGLEITGKRPDGYHTLKSIFQTIDLYDTIKITPNGTGEFRLSGDAPGIEWDRRNTIHAAYEAICTGFGVTSGLDVHVTKRIPAGSGLGGGSSNAALMLMYLIRHFELDIPPDRLLPLAAGIGADVPFFLYGGTAVGEGIGDILTPLPEPQPVTIHLVIPPINVPTSIIFSNFVLTSRPRKSTIETFMDSLSYPVLENDLEEVTFKLFPQVGQTKEKMQAMNYKSVLMSGSGAAVYGIVRQGKSSSALTGTELSGHFPGSQVFVTRTIGRDTYFNGVGASPSGKAPVFGAGTRRFESSRPSHS